MPGRSDFVIRTMTYADLERALDWAATEGWNPGRGDAEPFFAADPAGYQMGWLGDEPATAISVVAYDNGFGFLGLYICRPEFRGQGLGWRTWQAGIERLGGRTIGLDGVVAQQANYRRSGFELAHRNIRFTGTVTVPRPNDPRLLAVDAAIAARLAGYDAGLFPADRGAFLRRWLQPDHGRRAFAWIEDGALRGYGVVRPAMTGFKIGPLFAEDAVIADRLFQALAAEAGGAPVFIDPPEPNEAALALVQRYGLVPVFETARMYRGSAPELPLNRIFGLTSFELG